MSEAAGVRYEVIGGGEPSADELAALAVALEPQAAAVGGTDDTIGSLWAVAARHEAVGHRPFTAWADLMGGRFPLG